MSTFYKSQGEMYKWSCFCFVCCLFASSAEWQRAEGRGLFSGGCKHTGQHDWFLLEFQVLLRRHLLVWRVVWRGAVCWGIGSESRESKKPITNADDSIESMRHLHGYENHAIIPLILHEAREDTPIISSNKQMEPQRSSPSPPRRRRRKPSCLSTPLKRQRTWTLAIYALTTVFLFADQNLLSPNLSAAAKEFGFNDIERDEKLGGHIAIAFFLVGAPASFIVGCLADSRYIRRNILFGFIVLIGEGACMATYFTTTYTGLYVTRALTGFSVGGALPVLSSVLGDWYPPEDRSAVMAFVGVGSGLGIAMGQGISGMIGPRFGWKTPFLIVSIPALLLALLNMFTVKDPKRGEGDRIGFERRLGRSLVERGHNHHGSSRSNHSIESCENARMMEDDPIFSRGPPESSKHENSHFIETQPSPPPPSLNASTLEMVVDFQPATHTSNQPIPFLNSTQPNHVSTLSLLQENNHPRPVLFKHCPKLNYTSHLQTTLALLKTRSVLLTIFQGAPGCIPWGIVNTYLNDYLSHDHGMTVQGATLTLLVFGAGNFMGMILAGAVGRFLYRKDVRYPTVFAGIMAMLGCIPLWLMINYIDLNPSKSISAWSWLWIFFVSFLAGVCSGVTGPIVKAILQNVTLPDARGQAFAMLNTTDDFGRGLGPYFVSKLIQSLGGRQRAFNIGTLGWVLCGLFILCMYFTVRQDEERVQSILLDDFSIVSSSMEGSTSVAVGNGHEESSFLLVDASEVESLPSSTNNRVDPVSFSAAAESDMAIKKLSP